MGPILALDATLGAAFRLRGRAPRAQLWWWLVFAPAIFVLAVVLAPAFAPSGFPAHRAGAGAGAVALGLLAVPSFALAVRRARDAGLPRVIAAPFALVPIAKAAAYAASAAGAVLLPAVLGTTAGWTWGFWNVPVGVAGGVRGYPGGLRGFTVAGGVCSPHLLLAEALSGWSNRGTALASGVNLVFDIPSTVGG